MNPGTALDVGSRDSPKHASAEASAEAEADKMPTIRQRFGYITEASVWTEA